jgi:hypothetical protein
MKVLINGLEKEVDLSRVQNLEEALEVVSEVELQPQHIITQVEVNGEHYVPGKGGGRTDVPFGEVKSLTVSSSLASQVIAEGLKGAMDYLQELVPLVTRISELLRVGKNQEAHQLLAQSVEGLQQLINECQVLKGSIRLVYEGLSVEHVMILEGKGSILDLLKELLKVQSNRDWVLLADLLEYELVPLLQNWSQELAGLRADLQK